MLSYIWKRLRSEERGFTLIELLIVILILGILAAIAIFASEPFRARAAEACELANDRIEAVADAAIGAGVDPDLYWQAPGDCQTGSGTGGGPGGGGSSGLTATFVAGQSGGASATVTAVADELIVAIASHRTHDSDATHPGVASAPGYDLRGVSSFKTAGSTADRRAIAVFTRIATGTAADNFTPSFTGATVVNVQVQRFTVSSAPSSFTFAATPGTGSTVTTYSPLNAAAGGTGNNLMVVGLTMRDSTAGTVSWSGASNPTTGTAGSMEASMASATVSGAGPHSATPSWTTPQNASGFVLIIR